MARQEVARSGTRRKNSELRHSGARAKFAAPGADKATKGRRNSSATRRDRNGRRTYENERKREGEREREREREREEEMTSCERR